MKTRSRLNRNVQLAFGSAILTLLAVGAFSYRDLLVSAASYQRVRHTRDVLENLEDLLSATEAIESSYRGFALTGKESYLENYRPSILRSQQEVKAIGNLTADENILQSELLALERLSALKIEFGDKVIALRRSEGLEGAADSIRTGEGQRMMDEYRDVIRKMQDEELRLLVLRSAYAQRRLGQTKTVLRLGTVLGLLIVGAAGWSVQRDSSKRGLAEEALRNSDEKYRRLLDGVQDYAIYLLDPQGHVASWNAGAERIKGYKTEEIMGRSFSCFFSPEDIERGWPDKLLGIAAANGRYEEQIMRVRKDGSQFLAHVTLAALRDPAGTLRGFSEISHDISERVETEAKYRGLLEAAPDAMVVVNQGGEIVLLNMQAEKQFGYRRDELVGQKVTNIIPQGFAERLIADGARAATDALVQPMGTGLELAGRRKNGSDFPIEIMLSPLESAEGVLVTAAIRDISARKEAEKRLAQMEGRVQINKMQLQLRDDFLSHVSHELRSPLTAVYQFATILADGLAGETKPEQDEYLRIILRNVRQLQCMIDDLLEVTRGQAGKLIIEPQCTSVSDAIAYTVNTLQGAATVKGVTLCSDTGERLPPVNADPTRVQQVLIILVDNAIKFTPGGGAVKVATRVFEEDPCFVLVEVSDTGCGISPEMSERIFEHLYQVTDAGQAGRKGLGLGLYIARELVTRQGGKIWVRSEPQKGSRFYFTVPVFSVARLLGRLFTHEKKPGDAIALFTVEMDSPGGWLSPDRRKEVSNVVRTLLQQCLRPDTDVLLPNMGAESGRELFFVVAYTQEYGADVISERMQRQFQRCPQLQPAELRLSVSHCFLAPIARVENEPMGAFAEQVAAGIQDRINAIRLNRSLPT